MKSFKASESQKSNTSRSLGRAKSSKLTSRKSEESLESVVDDVSIEAVPELTEEEKAELELAERNRKREEERLQYINEKCTTLNLMYLDTPGITKDVILYDKFLLDYNSLQREVARIDPKGNKLLVCQYPDGSVVTASNFVTCNWYRVREMPMCRRTSEKLKVQLRFDKLPIYWEFKNYSGATREQRKKGDWLADGIEYDEQEGSEDASKDDNSTAIF